MSHKQAKRYRKFMRREMAYLRFKRPRVIPSFIWEWFVKVSLFGKKRKWN